MLLFSFLVSLFILLCLVLILLVLVQKGKSSMGIGALGGGTQMLFGGSGGQDLFQKTTWVLGAIFMLGSLGLALMKKPPKSVLQKLAQNQTKQLQKQKTQTKETASQKPENKKEAKKATESNHKKAVSSAETKSNKE